jgi:hypothetical protein
VTNKLDFKRSLDAYRARRGLFRIVKVPALQYLMIDGRGDPNTSSAFADAVTALYTVAYKLKFASKRDLGRDYVVMPSKVCGGPRTWTPSQRRGTSPCGTGR